MADVASDIRSALPQTDEIVVQYLHGLYEEPDEDYEDIMTVTKGMLESFVTAEDKQAFRDLMKHLGDVLSAQLDARRPSASNNGLTKLDRVMEMNQQMSSTIAMAEGVDLSSINKGKWVARSDLQRRIATDADTNSQRDSRGYQKAREAGS